MYRILSLFAAILFYNVLNAQVNSISPNSSYPNLTFTATLKLDPGILQNDNPPTVTTDIYLEQNGSKIYTDAFSTAQIFPGTAPYTDSLSTDFTIPLNAILGWYDVHVITYTNPGNVPVDNILTNGFLVPAVGSCAVPFNITSDPVSGTKELIGWSPTVVADTFRIRYRKHGTTNYFYKDVNGAGNVSTDTLKNLLPFTQFDVDVSTICNGIRSTYSIPVDTFTTLAQNASCIPPYGVTTSNVTNSSIQVNWPVLIVADTFRIRYGISGTTNYRYKDYPGGGFNSVPIIGLRSGTPYDFQVSSICNGIGNGYSPVVTATTLGGPVACATPFGTDTSGITNVSAIISWTPHVSADTFRINFKKVSGGVDLFKDVNGLSGNSTTIQNLDPNTAYTFRVSSVCSGFGGGYSGFMNFTTRNIASNCTTIPFGLSSTPLTNSSATVNWTPLVTADSFLVRYSVNGTTNYKWKMVTGSGGNHQATLTGLLPNTTYQWQVRTDCNGSPLTPYSVANIFNTPLRIASHDNENEILNLNLSNNNLSFEFTSDYKGSALVSVIDLSGIIVLQREIEIEVGENTFNETMDDFSRGIYIFRFISESNNFSRKIFIGN